MVHKPLISLCGSVYGSCGSIPFNLLILLNRHLRKLFPRSLRIYFGSRACAARRPNTIWSLTDLAGGVA